MIYEKRLSIASFGKHINCILLIISVFLFISCTVPKNMRVRSGIDPRYQDDNVRFRTTYYFRVFDLCEGNPKGKDEIAKDSIFINKTKGSYKIIKDSLYRFRMTGKAGSLSNKVHFESGTLKKHEIDPFGTAIELDKKTGRFHFVTQKKTEKAIFHQNQRQEIKNLLEIYSEIKQLKQSDDKNTSDEEMINKTLGEVLKNIEESIKNSQQSEPNVSSLCEDSTQAQRGFQILGPEGLKTFDQNERLILAMSSSGKPLIGTMKELAGRMINEKQSQAEILLPLTIEHLRISKTERKLDQSETNLSKDALKIIEEVIEEFKADLLGKSQEGN